MPEIMLLGGFLLSLLILRTRYKEYQFALAARIGMAVMLLTTAIAHFVFTDGMALMLPGFWPYKKELVYLTGILEAAAAVGLLFPRHYRITGWLVILFFILILPANIYAVIRHVNMEKVSFDGKGPAYLWYRVPLQLFFIFWVYFSCVRPVHNIKTATNQNGQAV